MKRKSEFGLPSTSVSRDGRTIYFFDEVNEDTVMETIKAIAQLQRESKTKPITMIINSPGGSCYDGLALYDVMRASPVPIITVGMGMVASMGFIIYLAGDKRISAPSTRYLNHQVSSGIEGKATDIKIQQAEIEALEDLIVNIVAERTSISKKIIKKDVKLGDRYYNAKEALKQGIVHSVISYTDKVIAKESLTEA